MDTKQLLRDAMRTGVAPKKAAASVTLDSASNEPSAAANYAEKDIQLKGVTALHQWAETDDLDSGEGYADRLLALFVGIADENKDGDITDEEQEVLEIALGAAWDYLASVGADEEDIDDLLGDFDEDAAGRVRELLASSLPDGEDESGDAADAFVFSDEDQEPALDAAYKKVMAIRKGRKVRINKRISGRVRLSARQKVAIRKARMKSHSAKAVMRRAKSMRLRGRMGMGRR